MINKQKRKKKSSKFMNLYIHIHVNVNIDYEFLVDARIIQTFIFSEKNSKLGK